MNNAQKISAHKRKGRLAWLGALLLTGALFGGCAADQDANAMDMASGGCESSTECPLDQVCRANLCSNSDSTPATLNFRFIPPGNSDYLPQYHEFVHVQPDQPTDFLLRPALSVRSGDTETEEHPGGIRYAGSSLSGPAGTLIFRPVDARSSLFIRETHVDYGTFHARLNPGEYSMTFVPNDREALPKKTWAAQKFTNNTILLRTLPAPSEYLEVTGTLARDVTLPSGQSVPGRAVPNARIYARSSSGEYSSTVATTDASGYFTLKVEPNTGSYDIFVVPATSDSMLPSTELTQAFVAGPTDCELADGTTASACNLGQLSLGAYPSEPIEFAVQLTSLNGFEDEFSLQGTMVLVHGELGNGEFSHKYPVSPKGIAELAVFPSDWSNRELRNYTLEVVPPANSPFARTQISMTGALEESVLPTFELGLKEKKFGRLISADGVPIANASLEFRRTSEPIARPETGNGAENNATPGHDPNAFEDAEDRRTFSVTTDEDGYFEVWLLPADYSVEAIPAQNSGQPRMHRTLSAEHLLEDEEIIFELPEPQVIFGSLFGRQETAGNEKLLGLGEVGVEAYTVIDGRTVVLGQALSWQDGRFEMVIPASP